MGKHKKHTNHPATLLPVIPTKPVSRRVTVILLVLIMAVALWFRVYLPYHQVMTPLGVKFSGNDAYYQMRLVDVMVHNFPHQSTYDSYFLYPNGGLVSNMHFFDWFLAAVTWAVGLGHPSPHMIDVIGAYYPVVLAVLTLIPIYFIGKVLWNRWAGLFATLLLAILPGEFMGRSILGFTDTHVAEVFLSSMVLLFIILAVKASVKVNDWQVWRHKRVLLYAGLAGFWLVLFMLTWAGSLLFLFLFCLFIVMQMILNHWRQQPSAGLITVAVPIFTLYAIVGLLASLGAVYWLAGILGLAAVVACYILSKAMRHWKAQWYPIVLVSGVVLFVALLATFYKPAFAALVGQFAQFIPQGGHLTISEAQPLFTPNGRFTWILAWNNFTVGFFLAIPTLIALAYFAVKRNEPTKVLFVLWSLIIFIIMVGQRRFAYYFALNVSLLIGYLAWTFLSWIGVDKLEAQKHKEAVSRRPVLVTFGLMVIFVGAYVWNVPLAIETARGVIYAPSDAWLQSMEWLKNETPDPFNDPSHYYVKETSVSPASYGVMAWWDYGYWITRIGHRIPNSNPSQDLVSVNNTANFFISQDEVSADKIADAVKSKYIVLDTDTAYISPNGGGGKFWAMPVWVGKSPNDYFEMYYAQQQQGNYAPVIVYYPAYFQAMSTRLYNFDGKPAQATPLVIGWRDDNGRKVITETQQFATYQDALNYVGSHENTRIVSNSPMVSPLPLNALQHYKMVYASKQTVNVGVVLSQVKVFEYVP